MKQPSYREDVSWRAQFQNCFPYSGIRAGIWLGGGDEIITAALLLCVFFPLYSLCLDYLINLEDLLGGRLDLPPLYDTLFLVRASQCV